MVLLDEATELDPFLPVWCIEERAAELHTMDRFEEALEAARSLPFQRRCQRLCRAVRRTALGDLNRARHLVAKAIAANPNLTTLHSQETEYCRDRDVKRLLIDRLVDVGLPGFQAVARKS